MKIAVSLDHESWERLLLAMAEMPYRVIEPLAPILKEIQKQGAEQFKQEQPS